MKAATTYPDARTKEKPRAPPGQLVLALTYLVQSGSFCSRKNYYGRQTCPCSPCFVTQLLTVQGCNMSSRLRGFLRLRKEILITRIENVVLLISQESIVSLLVL